MRATGARPPTLRTHVEPGRALGVRSGRVAAQAISKTARQVAHRRGKERRLDRQPARIEAWLDNELQLETPFLSFPFGVVMPLAITPDRAPGTG